MRPEEQLQMVEQQLMLMQEGGEQESAPDEPMDENEILEVIATEMNQSATGTFSTEIDGNREEALEYYLGNPRGDEEEGRSQVISTDVADAIEWIMPQIIKAMVAKGPVVEFDAVSAEDEMQAELETEFTHDCFMKENEGFLNLYEYVKDALMQKNGIFKIYYDETDKVKTERYDGLNQQELEMLMQQPNVEVVDMDEQVDEVAMQQREQQLQQMQQQMVQAGQQMQQPPPRQPQPGQPPQPHQQGSQPPSPQQMQQKMQQGQQQMQQLQQQPPVMRYSVTVEVTTTQGKVRVDCVAPEDFRVNQHHDSLSLEEARFTAHVRLRTKSELIEEGFDPEVIMNSGDNLDNTYEKDHRFSAQDESVYSDPNYSDDESQTLLEVAECYMMIDVEKTGTAKLMQITTLGGDDPTDILDMQPCEENPFVSSTCIIMSHKFFGLSIHDRLRQLQDMKTSLWRNIMDNLYLQNNREKEVVEDQVNLDDLLVSRPGGVKRVKQPGMIRELQVQPIGQEGYQMLDYMDQVRTGRVGVSPDTAGNVDALGTAVGSEGVAQLLSAKEELTGLMVRVIAETGMKPAYLKIRDLLIRYKDSTTAFKFRGEWSQVNPSQWGERSRTTIKVGTGTGDDQRKVGAIQQVIAYQSQALQTPDNTLVFAPQIYEAMDEFCRVSGLKSAAPYFLDPAGREGKGKEAEHKQKQDEASKKQDQLNRAMAKANEQLGQAEMMKGQAALQSQQAKVQIEQGKMQMDGMKQQSDNQVAAMKQQLDEAKTQLAAIKDSQKLGFDYAKLEQDEALTLTELELKYNLEEEKMEEQHDVNQQQAQQSGAELEAKTDAKNEKK